MAMVTRKIEQGKVYRRIVDTETGEIIKIEIAGMKRGQHGGYRKFIEGIDEGRNITLMQVNIIPNHGDPYMRMLTQQRENYLWCDAFISRWPITLTAADGPSIL